MGPARAQLRRAAAAALHEYPQRRVLALAPLAEAGISLPRPVTSFCEPHTETKKWHWFARGGELRQPFAFAGVWRPWTGARGTKSSPVTGDHLLYSILTTNPNGIVGPIHPNPVLPFFPGVIREGQNRNGKGRS
jgi:hypothetical protein